MGSSHKHHACSWILWKRTDCWCSAGEPHPANAPTTKQSGAPLSEVRNNVPSSSPKSPRFEEKLEAGRSVESDNVAQSSSGVPGSGHTLPWKSDVASPPVRKVEKLDLHGMHKPRFVRAQTARAPHSALNAAEALPARPATHDGDPAVFGPSLMERRLSATASQAKAYEMAAFAAAEEEGVSAWQATATVWDGDREEGQAQGQGQVQNQDNAPRLATPNKVAAKRKEAQGRSSGKSALASGVASHSALLAAASVAKKRRDLESRQ
jgi:hypothetical protein